MPSGRWELGQDAIAHLRTELAGGCYPNHDPAAATRDANVRIEQLERIHSATLRFVSAHTQILGRATTPDR